MDFLKKNIITDLINNKIEIKPLSIFKLILAYITQNIVIFLLALLSSFFYGFYITFFTSEPNFIFASILSSFATFIGILITIKIFSKKRFEQRINPIHRFPYFEDVTANNRQQPLKLNKKVVIACICLGVGYLLMNVATLHHLLVNFEMPAEITESFNLILDQNFLFILFSMVIEAAFVEEILCRGFILNGLLNKYSPKFAIFISATFFGLLHMNIPQFINATIIGIILGTIYYKTRSLTSCMIVHAANNFFTLFLMMPDSLPLKVIVSLIYFIIGFLLFSKGFKDLSLTSTLKELFLKKRHDIENIH